MIWIRFVFKGRHGLSVCPDRREQTPCREAVAAVFGRFVLGFSVQQLPVVSGLFAGGLTLCKVLSRLLSSHSWIRSLCVPFAGGFSLCVGLFRSFSGAFPALLFSPLCASLCVPATTSLPQFRSASSSASSSVLPSASFSRSLRLFACLFGRPSDRLPYVPSAPLLPLFCPSPAPLLPLFCPSLTRRGGSPLRYRIIR